MIGLAVGSDTDFTTTFLLDSHVEQFVRDMSEYLPHCGGMRFSRRQERSDRSSYTAREGTEQAR
jgi:hypothetical protein